MKSYENHTILHYCYFIHIQKFYTSDGPREGAWWQLNGTIQHILHYGFLKQSKLIKFTISFVLFLCSIKGYVLCCNVLYIQVTVLCIINIHAYCIQTRPEANLKSREWRVSRYTSSFTYVCKNSQKYFTYVCKLPQQISLKMWFLKMDWTFFVTYPPKCYTSF